MKMNENVNSLLMKVNGLSKAEQMALAEQIMKNLSAPAATRKNSCLELVASNGAEKPYCPHCHAKAATGWVIKRGMNRGAPRYYCKSCGKYFVSTTNTVFERSRKDADVWKKFIALTIDGKSLHECSAECGISYQTAFTWRHKVLNAFVANQEAVQMNGTIEVDEMLIPLSYKGNHIKGSFGGRKLEPGVDSGMPRKAFKRGTDNKSTSSKNKACVFCMVEDGNKGFYASVPGVGFMMPDMLRATVDKHVNKQTALMLADQYTITRKYFEDNGYKHRILSANTSDNPHDHKPEIADGLHMQHVNNMHRYLRAFLAKYCGVSSKYLANYVALYTWLKTVQLSKQRNGEEKASLARAAMPDCYVSRKSLESRPAIPTCA